MAGTAISLELLSSDAVYEREVLKLDEDETEDDLNQRIIQAACDAGLSDDEVAHCIGPAIVPFSTDTAPSSILTTAIHSPTSRGSVNTQSTAPTSTFSGVSTDQRPSMTRPPHRKNKSISSLFGLQKGSSPPSVESMPITIPETRNDSRRRPGLLVRDIEVGKRGFKKFSKSFTSFRKDSAPTLQSKVEHCSEDAKLQSVSGGIHTGVAGRISLKDHARPLVMEHGMGGSRPPSIVTDAGSDQLGFRSRSANLWKKKAHRHSIAQSLNGHAKISWSSTDVTDVASSRADTPVSPLPPMSDETEDDNASMSLQAMLASSPSDNQEQPHQEMKDAMKGRAFITAQALNRGELRRLKAFRNKQLMALATLHEIERSKMMSVFHQQQELINAKYRQAMIHLNEDRSILAELDLLAALDERLKKEQSKLRHMEAYCSPSSGRSVTSQNLQMLQHQKDLVDQLQSDKFSQDSLNHLREKQENDNARLPKQQQVELQELQSKQDHALQSREELEMHEVRELNTVIRRRRDASVARSNLRLEVWRRKIEAEQQEDLPGQLPYLRTEEVFESFWMVDVPLKSVLDDVLPWNEKAEKDRENALRVRAILEGKG